jgi:hypothetical protein
MSPEDLTDLQKLDTFPDWCSFWEKDNPLYEVDTTKGDAQQRYLRVVGREVLGKINWKHRDQVATEVKGSEYFFGPDGKAYAFRREHEGYVTVYPNTDLNTYYRFGRSLADAVSEIWFGRLFTDHGAAKQQDEMVKNLGLLGYRLGVLDYLSLGKSFVGVGDQSFPSVGRPSLQFNRINTKEPISARSYSLVLGNTVDAGIALGLDTPERCEETIFDRDGDVFKVSWTINGPVLRVEQQHINTEVRKIMEANIYLFPDVVANSYQLATGKLDLSSGDPMIATSPWLEMASQIGAHIRISGRISDLFEQQG